MWYHRLCKTLEGEKKKRKKKKVAKEKEKKGTQFRFPSMFSDHWTGVDGFWGQGVVLENTKLQGSKWNITEYREINIYILIHNSKFY